MSRKCLKLGTTVYKVSKPWFLTVRVKLDNSTVFSDFLKHLTTIMPLPNTLGLFVQIRSKHKDFTHKMPDTKSGIKHLSNLAQMQQNICTSIQGFYKKQFKSNMKVSESGGECIERNSQQAISHCYFVTVVWGNHSKKLTAK